MYFTPSIAIAVLAYASSVAAAPVNCLQDNVFRHLKGKSTLGSSFCATYTTAPATVGQAYPTWLSKEYTTSTSRLSSACSCLATASTTAPVTTSTSTSTKWNAYTPPVPSTISSTATRSIQPLPTITGGPLALSTAAVSDSIPPAPTKQVYFGNLGEDNSTALVAHVAYKAPADAPLVNLDDLISGLNGFPACSDTSISLKFISTANRALALTNWAGNKFTLVTSGGDYCGDEGKHNFFKVSAAASSGTDSVTLAVIKADIKDVLESFDTTFGTFNVSEPAPNNFRRDLEKRETINASAIWKQIVSVIKNGATKRYTTPQWNYDLTYTNLFQINTDGFSASVSCNSCGIEGAVQLFGQVSFDIKKLEAVGVVLGFDLVNPVFNLDMGIAWSLEYENSIETELFSLVPWSVEIPSILTIEPAAKLIAAVDLHIKSAFQIKNVGFTGRWDTLSIGYNLLTKLPVLSGNIVPQITYLEPRFVNGISPWGKQEAQATVWLGPRLGLEIDILSGAAHGNADITVQFPAVNIETKLDDLSNCPGASGLDMCVAVHSDAVIRGVATAGAGLVGVGDVGVEHELFNYNLGTIVDKHFMIDI
ncbi:hypothetical protein ABW20_dc0109998 [Dactylellina cionopaga]|nr:hypothetical protein ABW20_dc0109998 [Dactylellina cionopaga]